MTQPTIVQLGPEDARWVAERIAESFMVLPATRWLVPDEAKREAVLAGNFEIIVAYALRHGLVFGAENRAGVAVWLPSVGEPLPPPEDYDARLAAACGEWTPRFVHLDELFAANHPHEDHHHLALLAVQPDRQGQGIGTALLHHHHAWLDANGVAGYLEASSEISRSLYARHGYRGSEPFRLPDGTPFWPMWREPVAR
ncbi:N-acetyltransferase [Micromonospora craterilacus]|uniref:N-acetyltransferase n=1 Tax=Micromonospora craterilacus TaxID=1655439 RepID=A0A2W2E2T0_9ACTN|nr:GNAT family N-acetyltransferase [Micromonospora craterilacus]PZG10979.1 N-acetyltransferase [Micromonospora craterilacus]